MMLLLCLSWAAKTYILYYFFREVKGFRELDLATMILYPFNHRDVRKAFGDYNIAQSLKFLQEGKYGEANYQARVGLIRSPGNREGRLIVAQFEMYSGKTPVVTQLLSDGLKYHAEDIHYLRSLVSIFLQLRADLDLIQVAEKNLPSVTKRSMANRILALGAAQANFFRGRYDQAEKLIRDYQLDESRDGIALLAQIFWNRGQRQAAIDHLLNFIKGKPPEFMDSLYAILAAFYREMGDNDKAQSYVLKRMANNPFSALPRIELLYYYYKKGEKEKIDREADAIIAQFKRDEAAMASLGQFATDHGLVDLSRRVYEVALENSFHIGTFGLLYIEAHVVARKYQEAIEFCSELMKENPTWLSQSENAVAYNSLRSIAHYGLGNQELGDLYLNKFREIQNVRANTLILVAKRFSEIGLSDAARAILVTAVQRDPENQIALSGIIDIDLQQGNSRDLSENIRRLLTLRRPSYDLLRRAYRELNSDRFIYTKGLLSLLIDLRAVLEEQNSGELASRN